MTETAHTDVDPQDLADALDHMSDFANERLDLEDFTVDVRVVPLEELNVYDDLSYLSPETLRPLTPQRRD